MRRGQTALEYVYLIGIVAAAIITILFYISRGFQGNLRDQADQMGDQYDPTHMRSGVTTQITNVTLNDYSDKTNSTSNTTSIMTTIGTDEIRSLK